MKKLRICLMVSAIVLATCSAFINKKYDPPCEDCPQYYRSGNTYVLAGEYGLNYDCDHQENGAITCTFYKPDPFQPNYYAPSRFGYYVPLNAIIQAKK